MLHHHHVSLWVVIIIYSRVLRVKKQLISPSASKRTFDYSLRTALSYPLWQGREQHIEQTRRTCCIRTARTSDQIRWTLPRHDTHANNHEILFITIFSVTLQGKCSPHKHEGEDERAQGTKARQKICSRSRS